MKSLAHIEAAIVIAIWLVLSLAYFMARGALRFVARLWRRY